MRTAGRGKGSGSQAWPRNGHVHISQEQPQLSQPWAACVTKRSLRNWGKGVVGGVPGPNQLRQGARLTHSTGQCREPGTPDLTGLQRPIAGMPPAFSTGHQERRTKVTFPISQLEALGPGRCRQRQDSLPRLLGIRVSPSYVLPGPRGLTTVHPALPAWRWPWPPVHPSRPPVPAPH